VTARLEAAALVALVRSNERRWQEYADRVEECGSAVAVLEQERGAKWRTPSLFGEERDIAGDVNAATGDITRWQNEGIRTLTVLDRDYPQSLRAVHDRPPLIFVRGHPDQRDARSVAVIGSRNASPGGIGRAKAIASHLIERGYVVVSGLAAGIDTAAHEAVLAEGGRTVAVIGTGLRHCYPPQNAGLQRLIASDCAVVSRFWPDALPERANFPMRNALMSGLARATVIVEASQTSGARTQARFALAHGRPVFLSAPLLSQRWANELAARPGTHVVESAEEITSALDRLSPVGALVT
jgi:DNA processing protein